jgi:hypothetical protein
MVNDKGLKLLLPTVDPPLDHPLDNSRTSPRIKADIMTSHDWDCLAIHTFVPCPQFFLLLKTVAHVCTLKMAEDELSASSASSHGMSQVV